MIDDQSTTDHDAIFCYQLHFVLGKKGTTHPQFAQFDWDIIDESISRGFDNKNCYDGSQDWEAVYHSYNYTLNKDGGANISLPMTRFARCFRLSIRSVDPPVNPIVLGRIIVILYNTEFKKPIYNLKSWVADQTKISKFCESEVKLNLDSSPFNVSLENENSALVPEKKISASVLELEAQNYTCEGRNRSVSYDLRSGYIWCQCDALCTAFGDCCPDHWATNPQTHSTTIIPRCISTEFESSPRKLFPEIGFYLITSCKIQYRGHFLEHNCLVDSQSSHHENLFHMPVQISRTHQEKVNAEMASATYRNVYCALCNDEKPQEFRFWNVSYQVEDQKRYIKCLNRNYFGLKSYLKSHLKSHLKKFRENCGEIYGYSVPGNPSTEITSGESRMGKLCFLKQKAEGGSEPSSKKEKMPIYVRIFSSMLIVVKDSVRFCEQCHRVLHDYVTSNMNHVAFFIRYGSPDMKFMGRTSLLFEWDVCSETNISGCLENEQERNWRDVLSISGSCISTAIFLGILVFTVFVQPQTLSTRGKRDQFGVIMSKLCFHFALCGGSIWKDIEAACKVFAVGLHYSMLVCFGTSLWFGWSVANIFWRLNHNELGMAQVDQSMALSCREVFTVSLIWIGSGVGVVCLWFFDTYVDDTFIGYGDNGKCYVTKRDGLLYLVVIPTSIAIFSNFACTFYSTFHFIFIVRVMNKNFSKLLRVFSHFLARLMAFQMIQWIFGLIYHFSPNQTIGLIFEVFIAFEGVFMFALIYFKQCFAAIKVEQLFKSNQDVSIT